MKPHISKLLSNSITNKELQELNEWLVSEKNQDILKQYILDSHDVNLSMLKNNLDESFLKVIDKIEHKNSTKSNSNFNLVFKRRYLKYAASLLIFISLGYFYLNKKEDPKTVQTITNTQILAGTDKAILTLEDGTNITLKKGETYQSNHIESNGESLRYNASTKSKTDIAYNYISIPRGGEFFVILSDGTKVWLNSESKLKYPVNFISGDLRKVELLYGEAYFDVSSSDNHSGARFRVITQGQEVEVLGTEFNIKAYKSDNFIATTLIEGRVAVTHMDSSMVLKPSQQTIITDKTSDITINTVDIDNEIAWKNGFFSFEKQSLHNMLKTLSRWYDVTIVYKDQAKKNLVFSGALKRTSDIKELLINIEETERVEFEIEGKTIIVK